MGIERAIAAAAVLILFGIGNAHAGTTQTEANTQAPATIDGMPLILDGDTLDLTAADGTVTRIRLFGIDAPEMKQWPEGPAARAALDRIVQGQPLTCEPRGKSHKRTVALCRLPDGTDIGEALIRSGLAVGYRTYLKGTPEQAIYAAAEKQAIDTVPKAPWYERFQNIIAAGIALLGAAIGFGGIWYSQRRTDIRHIEAFEREVARKTADNTDREQQELKRFSYAIIMEISDNCGFAKAIAKRIIEHLETTPDTPLSRSIISIDARTAIRDTYPHLILLLPWNALRAVGSFYLTLTAVADAIKQGQEGDQDMPTVLRAAKLQLAIASNGAKSLKALKPFVESPIEIGTIKSIDEWEAQIADHEARLTTLVEKHKVKL